MHHSGIVFHLPADWVDDPSRMLPFYRKITAGLTAADVPWQAKPFDRQTIETTVENDPRFHILNHGQICHSRVLNAGIAYVYPFWNLDPKGIRAFSSIADMPFRPGQIDGQLARQFAQRLIQRQVAARTSRYEQPSEHEVLPAAAVAVFLQSEGHRNVNETLYLDRWQMLETTLTAAKTAPVIVKPHPREVSTETFEQLLSLQKRHPHLHISLGNIHDIIAASDRVVTINSAVGIEAYLHQKPVILCGQTDFHHIATTAKTPADLAEALTTPAPRRHYAKYLYWYFGLMCLNAGSRELTQDFLIRVQYHLENRG